MNRNSLFKPVYLSTQDINATPIVTGQFILDKMTGAIYVDESDTSRKLLQMVIDVTYNELCKLVADQKLIPGKDYLIYNYRTVWENPDNGQMMGSIGSDVVSPQEPLIVRALNNYQIDEVSVRSLYNQFDLIHYTLDNDKVGWTKRVSEDAMGAIYYRKDTLNNIEAHEDFRAIKYNRIKIRLSPSQLNGSKVGDVVTLPKADGKYFLVGYPHTSSITSSNDLYKMGNYEVTGITGMTSPIMDQWHFPMINNDVDLSGIDAALNHKEVLQGYTPVISASALVSNLAIAPYYDSNGIRQLSKITIGQGTYNKVNISGYNSHIESLNVVNSDIVAVDSAIRVKEYMSRTMLSVESSLFNANIVTDSSINMANSLANINYADRFVLGSAQYVVFNNSQISNSTIDYVKDSVLGILHFVISRYMLSCVIVQMSGNVARMKNVAILPMNSVIENTDSMYRVVIGKSNYGPQYPIEIPSANAIQVFDKGSLSVKVSRDEKDADYVKFYPENDLTGDILVVTKKLDSQTSVNIFKLTRNMVTGEDFILLHNSTI